MTTAQLSDTFRQRLKDVFDERETEAMLRVVWEQLKGWQPVDTVLHREDEIGETTSKEFLHIIERLEKKEPIQYILGVARFFGIDLKVTPDTLIPRPETEGLVQLIIDDYANKADLRIMDIGSGSGAIAVALAKHLPFSRVTALDISENALKVVGENAKRHHVQLQLVEADILKYEGLPESYDIVVSNPPYVLQSERGKMLPNVLDFEPLSAIFAPEDNPVIFYETIIRFAEKTLIPGGGLYFELNPLTADKVKSLAEANGFSDVEIIRDIHGRNRYLKAIKNQ